MHFHKHNDNQNSHKNAKPENFYRVIIREVEQEYIKRLQNIEKIHKQQIETERNIILNSWRWRIGNFQVGIIIAIKDLFVSLFRIISGKKFRFSTSNPEAPLITESRQIQNNEQNANSLKPNLPLVACIFDTFTYSCFKPEFNIISPYPDNWKKTAKTGNVNALFCESAWKGNNSSWRFYIGKLENLKKPGLGQMVEEFKKTGVPTIFWNKEDPVHFDHFIEDAKLFDYIFTSDASIIPKYQEYTNHNNIYALAFGAQEAIHNPIREELRDKNVCFAGTWYNTKYAERILDMEMILQPAMDYGLEIFDRNHGVTGYEKVMYGFPEIYNPFIKGKLEYHEMVKAYKKYKVFLNINSVRYSPTMLARRVFELLACGTPVISTYSEGIVNLLGSDAVMIAETEDETRRHLEKILSDESMWWSYSLRGIRNVLENHTYNHRTKEVFDIIGLPFETKKPPKFLVLAKIKRSDDLDYLMHLLNKQAYKNFEVLIFCDPENKFDTTAISQKLKSIEFDFQVRVAEKPVSIKQLIEENDKCDYVALLSQSNHYGVNYLRDFALATRYAPKVQIFGKGSAFNYTASSNVVHLNKGMDFQNVSKAHAASLVINRQAIINMDIPKLFEQDMYSSHTNDLLSIDPYNLLLNGRFADEFAWSSSEL